MRHIVSARIKEVYIGVEDDNPAVAGKGIEHLRRNGVIVHMFDRDLQEVILKENLPVFEWARKQPMKPPEEPIKLSKYEEPIADVVLDDLSDEALKLYRAKAEITPDVKSDEFLRLLRQLGLVAGDPAAPTPTGFGYLLFGKHPRNAVPHAGLLARAELATGESSRKEFRDAMVQIPQQLEEWLKTVFPSTIDRSRMERREYVGLPFEVIREVVVNALIHRDYNLTGQKCHLIVDANTITVKSPGGPIHPITIEQMRSFSVPIKSRNPILHYIFARMKFAEEMGFGLSSLKNHAERHDLPLPTFSMDGEYLVLTIFRSRVAASARLGKEVLDKLNEAEKAGWEWLSGRSEATQADYAKAMNVTPRTAQRHLKKFVELGLLRKVGASASTRYQVSS